MQYIIRKGLLPLLLVSFIVFGGGCNNQHVHSPMKVEAVSATCDKTGNMEYYFCESCQKAFKDEECQIPTTIEEVQIPSRHTFDETCWGYTDGEGHARTCACGEHGEIVSHISGGEATETSPELCTVCGYEIAPILGHQHDALPDDGDCTTPILCVCNRVMVEGEKSHRFDNACDTSCNNQGCLHARTVEGHKDTDNNGKCDYCNEDVPKNGGVELPEDKFD